MKNILGGVPSLPRIIWRDLPPIWFQGLGIRFLARKHFCECWGAGPKPQPRTWRTRVSLFVWPFTLILSGKGDLTSSYATTGIALRILKVRELSHLVQSTFIKVEIPSIGTYVVASKIWICRELVPWHITYVLGFIISNFLPICATIIAALALFVAWI